METVLKVLNQLVEAGLVETYAIGGAVAALFYAEPVATHDLDVFVVLPESQANAAVVTMEPQLAFLKGRGGVPQGEHVVLHGIPVQLLTAYNSLVLEATRDAQPRTVGATLTRVVRVEHLLAISVQTGRAKDRARVEQLLEEADVDRAALASILERFGLTERWAAWSGGVRGT